MRLYYLTAAALALAACGNDATPAQEQRAEELRSAADLVEQRGDRIEERADQQADIMRDRADALDDGEVPVQTVPPADPALPPMNALGAGENG